MCVISPRLKGTLKAGAEIVAHQRELVAKLERMGCDLTKHKAWLALLEDMQRSFVEHRATILRELTM
jgi:hypothetical protein